MPLHTIGHGMVNMFIVDALTRIFVREGLVRRGGAGLPVAASPPVRAGPHTPAKRKG